MLSKVTAKNVGDVFFDSHCILKCMYIVEVCLTSMPSSSVHLALEAWTVHVVAACKAFQIAREAVQISNSTTTVTVVLYSHYQSRATLVKWLSHIMLC